MSLANACIVRMAEIYDRHAVLAFDSDFSVYRQRSEIMSIALYEWASVGYSM